MLIYLTEDIRISGDPLNFIIEETYLNKKCEIKWKVTGYYPTYQQMYRRLLEKQLRTSDIKLLSDIENVLDRLTDKMVSHMGGKG